MFLLAIELFLACSHVFESIFRMRFSLKSIFRDFWRGVFSHLSYYERPFWNSQKITTKTAENPIQNDENHPNFPLRGRSENHSFNTCAAPKENRGRLRRHRNAPHFIIFIKMSDLVWEMGKKNPPIGGLLTQNTSNLTRTSLAPLFKCFRV